MYVTHIFANALCAFGVTRLVKVPFRLLLSDWMSGFLIIGPPLIRTGTSRICTAKSRPVGRLQKPLCLLQVLANMHYFALWIHNIIHTNLNFCSTSNVLFTFSIFSKIIIFKCSFKALQNAKAKLSKNDRDYCHN